MREAYDVIDRMVLTEKATALSENENKCVFLVRPGSNKIEIKSAVESLFDVKVVAVNTMNRRGKKKRERTRNFGYTSRTQRAVVTLARDNKIDIT